MRQFLSAIIAVIFVGASLAFAAGPKVVICHIPPGNPDNPQTIEVDDSAVPAHLAHGDAVGECASAPD